MPRMYCKKCPDSKGFNSWTNLRKHQWAAHRESYVNVGRTIKLQDTPTVSTKELVSVRDLKNGHKDNIDLVKKVVSEVNSEMTVSELLDKLRDQRNFMNDVVALIEGLAHLD